MCAPGISAIAGIGMGILQAGASAGAADADYAAKSAAWTQNVVNSEAAARDEQKQIIGNQLAEQKKLGQQLHGSFITQAQKQGTVAAMASSANVAGVSVENILQDIAGKSEENRTNAAENYKMVVADTQMKLRSSDDQLMSRINSVQRPVSPSPLAAIAGIGSSVVKGIGSFTGNSGTGDSGGSVSYGSLGD